MKTNQEPQTGMKEQGFSLLELMVALVVTLVITGSMWGLMASGQGSFRREPVLMDRQQQIRIAMTRVREDLQNAGLGLGNFFQSFPGNTNAVGVAGAAGAAQTGVRPAGDPLLGGGLPDFLEIRAQNQDCAPVRAIRSANSVNFDVAPADQPYPDCYAPPSFVLALYPTGSAKFALITHDPAGEKLQFAPGLNNVLAAESQFDSPNNIGCDLYLPTPATPCPVPNQANPDRFAKFDRIQYRLGLDIDGTPSLFRSATGGYDNVSGVFNTLPPGAAWQLVARGIEDFQVRYRTFNGWLDEAPVIAPPSFDNVVREVEVTMWARTVGESRLQGETLAAGNQVTAVRGSLVSSVSPRAAQTALMQELDPNKRWQ